MSTCHTHSEDVGGVGEGEGLVEGSSAGHLESVGGDGSEKCGVGRPMD